VAHVALGDHGLYFCAEHFLEAPDEVDLELVRILQDGRVEEDLVGFAEAEVELVLVEQLFVGLQILACASTGMRSGASHTFARLSFMSAMQFVQCVSGRAQSKSAVLKTSGK
jgi:hypothetical protein